MLDAFRKLFYDKLDLSSLDINLQKEFLNSITKYLDHGRKDTINGRTYEYIEKQLNELVSLLTCIGYSKEEMVRIITNLPSILNTVDELYKKYLFLGVIEDESNSIRRNKLLNKTKDFMVGFSKIYARYKLACEAGYDNMTWNILVHASDNEFARVFVKGTYAKPYQIADSIEQVLNLLSNTDSSEYDFEFCKSLDVNKELVSKYEERNKGM